MNTLEYGYEKHLTDDNFDDAVGRVKEALLEEGFGVLTEIDVKDTMKKKLDLDFRKYKILGACNPNLASKALGVETHIGLLLPCNVVVQQFENGEIVVSIIDPKAMFGFVDKKELESVAEEADQRLKRVVEKL